VSGLKRRLAPDPGRRKYRSAFCASKPKAGVRILLVG